MRGFTWDGSTYQVFGSQVVGVANGGVVVEINSVNVSGVEYPLQFPGATSTTIIGANAAGTLVGSYYILRRSRPARGKSDNRVRAQQRCPVRDRQRSRRLLTPRLATLLNVAKPVSVYSVEYMTSPAKRSTSFLIRFLASTVLLLGALGETIYSLAAGGV